MALETLPTAWEIEQYRNTVFMLAQQTLSLMAPNMGPPMNDAVGPIVEVTGYFGKTDSVTEVDERGADTGEGRFEGNNCWTTIRNFKQVSPIFEDFDKARTMIAVEGAWTQAAAADIARHIDRIALGSTNTATKNNRGGFFGVRYEGQHGETAVQLPTTDYATVYAAAGDVGTVYSIGADVDGAASPLTPYKLTLAEEVLRAREVLKPGERVLLGVNDRQLRYFKRHSEITNRDFEKAVSFDAGGQVSRYGIFDFVRLNGLPVDSGVVSLPVWLQSYLIPVFWMGRKTKLLTHSNRSGVYQFLTQWQMNVVRRHEEGVLVIKAKE